MTTPDHRDRAIDAALRRTAIPGRATGECLDADTLAAWAEQRLTGVALRRAEGHMADCARCQATLAVLVKAAPESGSARAHEDTSGKWWGWFDVRWLVPLTATAVLVWMLVPGEAPPDQLARVEPPARLDGPRALEAPRQPEPSPPPAPASQGERKTLQPERKTLQPEREADAAARANERVAQDLATAQPARQDVAAGASGTRAAAEPAAPSAVAPDPAESLGRDAAARFEAAPTAAAAARLGAAPATPAAAPGLAKAAGEAAGENRLRSSAGRITSGDVSVQWRLAPPSAVERSTDGGATWTRLDTGTTTRVHAGSAPASVVCWLVGENGLVLLTTDGRTWRALSSPVAESLVAVEATDATTAVVRSATGLAFRTTDGGASWTRQ